MFFVHSFGKSVGSTGHITFGYNHNATVFRFTESVSDKFVKLIHFCFPFRNNCRFSSRSQRAVQRKESCIAPHYFDKEKSFVRSGRITNFIHSIYNCVQCSIVTNGRIGTIKIVVDSAGQTYNRDIKLLSKNSCSGKSSIPTNHDKRIDFFFLHILIGQLATFGSTKLSTACTFQNCATLLNNITYILGLKFCYFTGYQPLVTSVNCFYTYTIENCSTRHRPDSGVHAGSITSRS